MSAPVFVLPLEALTLSVRMESDWHVGIGAGRSGHVDRLVQRDPDGIPAISAKTLNGMWRDGCERAAWALDEGVRGVWARRVELVFGALRAPVTGVGGGRPKRSLLQLSAAQLAGPLRERLVGREGGAVELREALTFVKAGVALDPRSGRAREEFLRFEEMARAEMVLEARVVLHDALTGEEREAASALLLAGLKLVERIGGKRRRGHGRCAMQLVGYEELASVATWLAQHEAPALPMIEGPTPPIAEGVGMGSVARGQEAMVSALLTLEVRSPLCASERTVGNIVESRDHVPGTVLLPFVTRVLGRVLGDPARITRAVIAGDLIITPATLAVGGEGAAAVRGLPMPFALSAWKRADRGGFRRVGGVINMFEPSEAVKEGRKTPEKATDQLKPCRSGYLALQAGDVLPLHGEVKMTFQTHSTIEDVQQRPSASVGGVYTYQAIQPGQAFMAELRLTRALSDALDKDDPAWRAKLGGPERLGRSRKDA